jgi:hypothetical protein
MRQHKYKTVVGHGIFRITTINLVAGKPGGITQVFSPCGTETAMTAGVTKPGYADMVSLPESRDQAAAFHHFADNFMPGDQGEFWFRKFTIAHVQIRPAYSAGGHTDQDLFRPTYGHIHLPEHQRLAGTFEHHGPHHREPRLRVVSIVKRALDNGE